ncbi:MAG: hypothetical protein RM022_025940 [Nostoc sp. EfeVER01]|uniref:hypothetical protein n=1 Tax=Nostoc sp. EfeVER01 TaxID=3075406 RepID=UPI002AD21557|nr:hypothetical protein [Nostoc sp. EfeVER01]MDZ7943531.1 hypothetical protein [Nostoc sp. EfeVER01]
MPPTLEDNFDSVNSLDKAKHWLSRSISRLWLTLGKRYPIATDATVVPSIYAITRRIFHDDSIYQERSTNILRRDRISINVHLCLLWIDFHKIGFFKNCS